MQTTSPTTTSRRGTSHTAPSRTTLTGMSSLTWLSRRKRRMASHSNQKPTHVARMMAQMMPMDSVKFFSTKAMASESTAAKSST